MLRIKRIELVFFLASGLTLLAAWGSTRFYGVISSKTAIARFEAAKESSAENAALAQEPLVSSPVDIRFRADGMELVQPAGLVSERPYSETSSKYED
jgi:hypothetical protein